MDWSKTTQSAGACIFCKDYESENLNVAYFWSRLLSSTFTDKSPYICELGSVVLFLVSNRYLIAGRMVTIWSDNLVATSILERRLLYVDTFDHPIVNRLLISIANYPFQVHYINTKNNVADFVSRYCKSREKPYEEILLQSTSHSDLDAVDQETYTPDSSIPDYLTRNKRTANAVRAEVSKSFDINDLKTRFQSSHVFSDDGSLDKDTQDPLLNIISNPEADNDNSDEQFWLQPITRFIKFEVPSHIHSEKVNCTHLFEESTDELMDNLFYTSNKSDLIDYLIGETKVNTFHDKEMQVLREDTAFLIDHQDLLQPILNGMDGLIDNDILNHRLILATYLQEMNVINNVLASKNQKMDEEPLFQTWNEVKKSMEDHRLTDLLDKKLAYFVEVQSRSKPISLLKKVLMGDADEEEVNLTKRTSNLFNELFNSKESLFIKNSLLFKIRFPRKKEHHNFCLILEPNDCERKMIQLHSKHLHRGYIFLFAIYSVSFYTPGALKIAYEVVSSCPVCQQMRPRKKLKVERLNISTSRLVWGIDHKGPMLINQKTRFVLCCVEINIRLVSFSLAKTTSAKETARLFFDNIICVYGGAVEIVSDRSTSFLNQLFDELMLLGGSRHRVTSSYSPWANVTEERCVRKLSNAIRATTFGRSSSEWASHLKYLQLMINSTTISPYLNTPPFALLFGSENSFFHPLLVVKQDQLPFSQFWNEKVESMRKVNDILVEKYDLFLSQKANKRHTVQTLGLSVGDVVWVRCFKFSPRLKYMKHILPKWKLAEIVRINGMTSLLLRDEESKVIISRHLQDVAPVKPCKNYSNLYTDSWTAHKNETEEDFEGKDPDEIPALDGKAIEGALAKESFATPNDEVEKGEPWKGRLRRKERRNYKE